MHTSMLVSLVKEYSMWVFFVLLFIVGEIARQLLYI